MATPRSRKCDACGWTGELAAETGRRSELITRGALSEIGALTAFGVCAWIVYAIMTGETSDEKRGMQVITAGVFGIAAFFGGVNAFYRVPRRIWYTTLHAPCWRCPSCEKTHWLRVLRQL